MQQLAQIFKVFETKPPDVETNTVLKLTPPPQFFKQNELSKIFGVILDRFHQFVQESFVFSFSKLFVYDVSQAN